MKRLKTKSKKKPGKGSEQIENEENSEDPPSDYDGNESPSGKRRFKPSGKSKKTREVHPTAQGMNITKEFSNFDLLWYDLSTKVRDMFFELNQPIIDKIYVQKDVIDQVLKHNEEQQEKIDELDNLVYNRKDRLDIF